MKAPLVVLIIIVVAILGFLLVYSQQREMPAQTTQGQQGAAGYGAPSGGHAPAAGGYGTPPATGGYGAPSGGHAPAGGYGAPSGGHAPAGGYGAPPAAGGYGK